MANREQIEPESVAGLPEPGAWGLIAYHDGEWYAVAARWGEAAAPVWVLTGDLEWRHSGHQVAYFRHSPEAAFEWNLRRNAVEAGMRLAEAAEWVRRGFNKAKGLG